MNLQPQSPAQKIDINTLTDMTRLKALLAGGAGGKRKDVSRDDLFNHMKSRVRGQDSGLNQIADSIYMGYMKQVRQLPVATFMLVGPPGTGKTEVAKAIAEYLFGSEGDMVFILGPEYKDATAGINRLIGSGAAYKASEQGGTLTRPMLAKRERVVLFDEVEKMNPECHDLFLSLLGEGYVTEQGTNKKADFSSSVVILTSNLDYEKCGTIAAAISDPEERSNAFKNHFNALGFARPEILNRIPNIVYFGKLPVEILAEVVLAKIVSLVRSYKLTPVWIDEEAAFNLVMTVQKSDGGIRDLIQMTERRIGMNLADLAKAGVDRVCVVWRAETIRAVDAKEVPGKS